MDWSGLELRQYLEVLSWKVDVEWGGLLFSKSFTNKGHVTDEIDWDALATSLGLSPNHYSSEPCPNSLGSVKVTGIVVLLGLGGFLCYKLYNVWHSTSVEAIEHAGVDDIPPGPPSVDTSPFGYNLNKLEPNSSNVFNEYINVQTCYFGPLGLKNEDYEQQYAKNGGQQYEYLNQSEHEVPVNQSSAHKRLSARSATHRKGWLTHKLQTLGPSPLAQEGGSPGNSTSTSSPGSSPRSLTQHRSLSRDLSFDSLVLLSSSHRHSSFDSICSDLSYDLPSLTEQTSDSVTVARLDKLQEEIEQIKSNCLLMDEEFDTVKCNRNLPGLSDLMESSTHLNVDGELTEQELVRQQSAKACFKGLYSLTTINHSMSMDLSIDEDNQPNGNQFCLTEFNEEETSPSLEWDDQNNCTSLLHEESQPRLASIQSDDQPEGVCNDNFRLMKFGTHTDTTLCTQNEWTDNKINAKNIHRVC